MQYLYAAVAICFWGSLAAITSLLLENLHTFTVLFYSSVFATLFLLIFNLATGRLRQLRRIKGKEYVKICILGMMGMFAYNLLLFIGLERLPAQQAFIINYLWPILTVAFSCIVFHKRLTARKGMALLISFIGIVIVATEGKLGSILQIDLVGVTACIGAAASYALFSVLNMKVTCCDKYTLTMLYYGVSAIVSVFVLPFAGPIQLLSFPQWIGMLWSGILVNGLAYTMWALALDKGDTAKISNLAYITPFLSLVYTYFLLQEQIQLTSFIGLAFIILGVLIQMDRRTAKKQSY